MTCPQCNSDMVKSYMLGGDEFFYCKTCKKELAEMQSSLPYKTPQNRKLHRAFHELCQTSDAGDQGPTIKVALANANKHPTGFNPTYSTSPLASPGILFWEVGKMPTNEEYPLSRVDSLASS